MELKLKPSKNNKYPTNGFLIKSSNIFDWAMQLQNLKIDLTNTDVFAIPGKNVNSIWGCFVEFPVSKYAQNLTSQEPCQSINNKLFIPQFSEIYPFLNEEDVIKLFPTHKCVFHPEIGLFELDSPINWVELLIEPKKVDLELKKPSDSVFIPEKINKIEIKALEPEKQIEQFEKTNFPEKQEFNEEPLNVFEKIKLGLLRSLFTKDNNDKIESSKLLNKISNLFPNRKLTEQLEKDLNELEKRNDSEMEKLMRLFKENPEEALKYAIPLDESGTTRGGFNEKFSLTKRWSDFSLFGQNFRTGSGGATFGDDSYFKLQQQYTKSAQDFIKNKQYEKAAFVFMKLLKNNYQAAQTLEEGKLYQEAASIYLKYVQNKEKAAECYEKGQMTTDAINIYKEIKKFEKVGDLYGFQNKTKESFDYYNYAIDEHKLANRHLKASLLYRQKMNDTVSAQNLLLEGWRQSKDAFNCLNNYFQNITDTNSLSQEIKNIYKKETNYLNKKEFLKVLTFEYKKEKSLQSQTKEIAYEIVSDLAPTTPSIVSELKNFNPDSILIKDIMRYKTTN
jgi:MoxR-vWA-beta-propeller ternary system domain bpX3